MSEHHIVLSRRSVNGGPLLMKMMGSNQFSSWWYSVPIYSRDRAEADALTCKRPTTDLGKPLGHK